MTKLSALICFAVTALAPSAALAYIGPGAGLSLLGALWALIAAIAAVLFFVIAWPIRKMFRRKAASRLRRGADHGRPAPVTVGSKASVNKTVR